MLKSEAVPGSAISKRYGSKKAYGENAIGLYFEY